MRHLLSTVLLALVIVGTAVGTAVGIVACGATPDVAEQSFSVRPTDGEGWIGNGYGDEVTVEHWDTPLGKFRMHYTRSGDHAVPEADKDSSGVPDFVEEFGLTFDDVYQKEIEELGFREPLSDAQYHDSLDYGGDARFDVYLQDRGGSADGYYVVEACSPQAPRPCAGYLIVENDFSGYSYPTPQDGMKVLASHEYFHAIQHAYRNDIDRAFSESTASWATEQIYPQEKDFEWAITSFFKEPSRPLDANSNGPTDSFIYGVAIWPYFLNEKFGSKILPATFEEMSIGGSADNSLDAVDAVLVRDHQSSLSEAFREFALWNLLTGSRSGGDRGYAQAAEFPEAPYTVISDGHPFRITGEIPYLSALYYQINIPKGLVATVTSEYAQAQVALHLITGQGDERTIASATATEGTVSLVSQGAMFIVAASVARENRHLPLSLAVRAEGAPTTPADAGTADVGTTDSGSEPPPPAAGGCSLADTSPDVDVKGLGGLIMLLGLALYRRRLLGPWFVAVLLPLVLLGCSDVSNPIPFSDGGADAVVVDSMPTADTTVDLPQGPRAIEPGDFVEFAADEKGFIEGVNPAADGQSYVLLLTSLSYEGLTTYSYKDATARSQTQAESRSDAGGGANGKPCRFSDEVKEILAEVHGKTFHRQKRTLQATEPPKVGDSREFKVRVGSQLNTITAEAISVDGIAVFWLDKTTTPLASIEPKSLAELADGFATLIVPRLRVFFGAESDVDGDGLISVLLSPLVPQTSAVAYVSPCDLVDPQVVTGCSHSNQTELVYLTPPNLMQGPYGTASAMLETVAHEFQHLIYFYRKFMLNDNVNAQENPYITEGLSALAQDLSGYQAGNFYVTMAGLNGIDLVSLPNFTSDALKSYVAGEADGIMRGAGYLILRYLYDQAGGDSMDAQGVAEDKGGITWLHTFIDQLETGNDSFSKSSGLALTEIVDQFWTALLLSNRGSQGAALSDNAKYNYLPTTLDPITGRQRGCSTHASFHGQQMLGPALQDYPGDGAIRGGGGELLKILPESGSGEIRFRLETEPAGAVKARLIRLK